MLVKLSKAWGDGKADQVVDVDAVTGAMLLRKKIGAAAEAPPAEAAVAPPAPERAVRRKAPRR